MRNLNHYHLLLVAGDYEIVQHTTRALPSARFSLQVAFNHREALHMVSQGDYNALIVDGAMFDRHSGDNTLQALKAATHLPMVAFAFEREIQNIARAVDVVSINVYDAAVIQRTIGRAFGIVVAHDTSILEPHTDDPGVVKQHKEFNTLLYLSKSLTEVLELTEVLDRVAEAARQLTNADESALFLAEGKDLRVRAQAGRYTAKDNSQPSNDKFARDVLANGQPLPVDAAVLASARTGRMLSAALYMPINLRDKTMGVLSVSNHIETNKEAFTLRHQQLLEGLASFAAVAIQNAIVHKDSLNRNRDMDVLFKASQALNSSLTLDAVFHNVCGQIVRALSVDYVGIYRWNRESDHLLLQARYDDSAWFVGFNEAHEAGELTFIKSIVRRMVVKPTPPDEKDSELLLWLLPDTKIENHDVDGWLKANGICAALVIPVAVFDEDGTFENLTGSICLSFVSPPVPLPPEAITDIVDSARQVVADMFNNPRRLLGQKTRQMIEKIIVTAGADWCDARIPQGVHARIGRSVWLNPLTQPAIALDDHGGLYEILKLGQPVQGQSDRSKSEIDLTPLLRQINARALLAVPIVHHDSVQGLVVMAMTGKDRRFGEREVMMAQAMVNQAAIAMENARLVHDLEASLTNLKSAQQRLVQTARLSAMGELAAIVAHQMNNPLTTIIGDTELMLLDEPPDSPRREALLAIAHTGKRAANVARRLLAVSRRTDHGTTVDDIDVVESLTGVISLLQGYFEHADIQIRVSVPQTAVPLVRAVKGRIDDIWINILMNAYDVLQYRKNAEIDVRVIYSAKDERITVRIRDNGPGIPKDIREQIFQPFFTTKPQGEGTGLGLHITRETVENIDGKIFVESELGEWTCFVVRLPIVNT